MLRVLKFVVLVLLLLAIGAQVMVSLESGDLVPVSWAQSLALLYWPDQAFAAARIDEFTRVRVEAAFLLGLPATAVYAVLWLLLAAIRRIRRRQD